MSSSKSPSSKSPPPFGTMSVPFPFSAIRRKALELAAEGNRKSVYAQINRTAAKFLRRSYDIEWEGLKLRVYPRENFHDKSIYNFGIPPEAHELEYLRTCYEGRRFGFVDIGANVGAVTLFMWKILDRDSRIIAYEPSQETFAKLAANLQFNHAKNVVAVNRGIGDAPGVSWLYEVNKRNIGERSQVSPGEGAKRTRIEIVTLEEDLKARKVSRIDFLKIDIEGYEDRALLPYLRACDEAHLPRHIMIEDNRRHWREDSFQALEGMNYELVARFGANHHYAIDADEALRQTA